MSRRESFTARRRAQLARRVAALEAMEGRAMITESLGLLAAGLIVPATAAALGRRVPSPPDRATASPSQAPPRRPMADPAALAPRRSVPDESASRGRSTATTAIEAPTGMATPPGVTAADWLTLDPLTDPPRTATAGLLSVPPALPGQATGGAAPNRGGAGNPARGTITPLRLPPPPATTAAAANSALGLSLGPAGLAPAAPAGTHRPTSPAAAPGTGPGAGTGTGTGSTASFGGGVQDAAQDDAALLSGGALAAADPGLLTVPGADNSVALGQFQHFELYTLDYHDGTVLFPGFVHVATRGLVDLRAQVRGVTVSSYAWDTTGLGTDAASITGTGTDHLTFIWNYASGGRVDSVTLTVTDSHSNTEVQTYSFYLPPGGLSTSGGTPATWPETLAPDTVLDQAPAFATHNAAVDADSGALDATIPLPAYNPNIPGIALTYDSLAADPRPMVLEHHILDDALSLPTKVSAQLTFNGSGGTTYYYDSSTLTVGDDLQIGLQADATALATGRYGYSVAVTDYRATNTTTTPTGTATVLNDAGSALGAGWTVAGLERITAATGGVILDLGGGDRTLWFSGGAGSGGATYTSPAGDFSTLVKDSGGTYARTLTDGTVLNFDTNGRETSAVDRNGLRTTYGYDVSGNLKTIKDPYSRVTTFAYSGGLLRTITDPANRVATFTHTGSDLTGVTLPDASAWAYGYDGAGRLTRLTDPNSHTVTVAYDAAERVATITRPDSTTETITAYQERGYDTSGTAASPAPAVLLAEARATHTDPNGHTVDLRADWRGLGLANQATDPDGNVATLDLDANGLATIAVDRLNRVTTYGYDTKGNVTGITYPDRNTAAYTYNGFAEVTSETDPLTHVTTYGYDGQGNLTTVTQADPDGAGALTSPLTTLTYTGNGMLQTLEDPNGHTTSYAYDSQDRLTTVTHPDGSTTLIAYDSQGDPATVTDERGDATTVAYDALDRATGTTDALGDRTTYTYDSGGNLTVVQAPLSRTTSYAYDSLDRLTTVTDPLSHATVLGYDSGGNLTTTTDPLGRTTTVAYDAEDRPTVVTTPLSGASTAVTTTTYDAEGQATRVADPRGRVTTTTYTSRGWVGTVTDPLGDTATYTYSATGKLQNQTDYATSGGTLGVTYTYDNLDRLTAVTDQLGHTTTTAYDPAGNVLATIDANGHATSYAYDARNRVTTITDPLSHATVYGYDSGGNRTAVTDPLGHTTTTAYDALNRATTLTDARGSVTTLAYDAAGRQVGLTDPNGNATTWAYDAADRLTTLTSPVPVGQNGVTTYAYDADDELTDSTDRDGRRTTFAYDSGGRQVNERWLDNSGGAVRTLTHTYDADNELTGASDPDATLTFTYDSGGRQVTAATSGTAGQPSVTLTSGYDPMNDRTSLSDNLTSVGRTTYSYDAAHRLTTITRKLGATNGPQVVFGYDPADRLTTLARTKGGSGTEVDTALGYDAANRLTTLTHQVAGGSVLASYVYAYDDANRLTTETIAGSTVTYTYDAADELTAAGGARTESYGYDSGGNRDTTGYTTDTGNELSASPGYTYTYDAEGNMTSQTQTSGGTAVTTYSYDYRNRLTGVTVRASSGGAITAQATYTYDPLDRRIGTDDTGTQTWTVFDGRNPYADFNGTGTLQERYLYGPAIDMLLARTSSGGTTAWYLTDHLGSVRDIASTAGAVIDHLAYDSYGTVTSESSPGNGDRFKFAGMVYDATILLYLTDARPYQAPLGRFLGRDPEGFAAGDVNLYRYTGNGPTNAIDPTGMALDQDDPLGGAMPPEIRPNQGIDALHQMENDRVNRQREAIADDAAAHEEARSSQTVVIPAPPQYSGYPDMKMRTDALLREYRELKIKARKGNEYYAQRLLRDLRVKEKEYAALNKQVNHIWKIYRDDLIMINNSQDRQYREKHLRDARLLDANWYSAAYNIYNTLRDIIRATNPKSRFPDINPVPPPLPPPLPPPQPPSPTPPRLPGPKQGPIIRPFPSGPVLPPYIPLPFPLGPVLPVVRS